MGDGGYSNQVVQYPKQKTYTHTEVRDMYDDLHPVTKMVHQFSKEFDYGPWIVLILIASGITHYSGIILGSFLRSRGWIKTRQNRRKGDRTDV